MVHAALLYSSISKGKIESIDTVAAEKAPGVLKVITHHNALKMKVASPFSVEGDPSSGSSNVPILNTDRIHYDGQPVAVVVADTEERAEHAASLIKITYKAEAGMNSFEEAIPKAKKPEQIDGCDSPEVVERETLTPRSKRPKHRVDILFATPPYNHNAIEPHALHRDLER